MTNNCDNNIYIDELSLNSKEVYLNKARKDYVLEFLKSLGYKTILLDDMDILSIFKLLARVEEFDTKLKHNNHNWELCYSSISRASEAFSPPIDNNLILWEKSGKLVKEPDSKSLWPNGKNFALCLTHDMDILSGNLLYDRVRSLPSYKNAPSLQKMIVMASTLREFAKKLIPGRKTTHPLLSEWLDLEDKYNFKSSMLFLAQPLPDPDWEDSFYSYNDVVSFANNKTTIGEAMKKIADMGWDVGLHGSTKSHASSEILKNEREIIASITNKDVISTRQHHLCYDIRYTPKHQSNAGFKADSSLGSNISSCYRCGTGYPFYHYDLIDDKQLDLLQIPLIIQDVALFRNFKMNAETAYNHCMELITETCNKGGAITLLWHNNYYIDDIEFKVYRKILEKSHELGAWGCSMDQLINHWSSRINSSKG